MDIFPLVFTFATYANVGEKTLNLKYADLSFDLCTLRRIIFKVNSEVSS